jgi:hypothetical protein
MTTWNRVQGDTDDTIQVILDGIGDLAAVTTVTAHVRKPGRESVELEAEVVDAAARTIAIHLGDWITDAVPGKYLLEIQPVIQGSPVTWPEAGPDTLIIRSQIA